MVYGIFAKFYAKLSELSLGMAMHQVNIHEAKTKLSKLIDEAVHGEPFIIAKAGKPLVKVTAITNKTKKPKRLGFMQVELKIPAYFDTMYSKEIANIFGASE